MAGGRKGRGKWYNSIMVKLTLKKEKEIKWKVKRALIAYFCYQAFIGTISTEAGIRGVSCCLKFIWGEMFKGPFASDRHWWETKVRNVSEEVLERV